jgi:hypothetical protein
MAENPSSPVVTPSSAEWADAVMCWKTADVKQGSKEMRVACGLNKRHTGHQHRGTFVDGNGKQIQIEWQS